MELLLLVLLSFFSSIVGTSTGFGTSTIMVPVLTLFYSFNPVLYFTGLVHLVNNMGKMVFFIKGFELKLILLFGIPGIVFGYIGSMILPSLPSQFLLRFLGIILIGYVIYIFKNPLWKFPKTNSIAILGGSLTGLAAAIFGVQGIVRAVFLSAFNLKKEVFLFTAGAIGFLIDISRIIGYIQNQIILSDDLFIAAVVSIPFTLFGSWVGKKLIDRIPQNKFRKLIAIGLLVIGVKYLLLG